MDPLEIIRKYYAEDSEAFRYLVVHSRAVARKAVEVAERVGADVVFVEEAAMLHDIGIFRCDFSEIGCHGDEPRIRHGIIGREILESEGLPRHALVCERHIGTGLTVQDIERQDLPLPHRDMVPVSIEEQIVCFADLFFSKADWEEEKSVEDIRKGLARHGADKVGKFDEWLIEFS